MYHSDVVLECYISEQIIQFLNEWHTATNYKKMKHNTTQCNKSDCSVKTLSLIQLGRSIYTATFDIMPHSCTVVNVCYYSHGIVVSCRMLEVLPSVHPQLAFVIYVSLRKQRHMMAVVH